MKDIPSTNKARLFEDVSHLLPSFTILPRPQFSLPMFSTLFSILMIVCDLEMSDATRILHVFLGLGSYESSPSRSFFSRMRFSAASLPPWLGFSGSSQFYCPSCAHCTSSSVMIPSWSSEATTMTATLALTSISGTPLAKENPSFVKSFSKVSVKTNLFMPIQLCRGHR